MRSVRAACRRLERNLHDGAQQRLLALAMELDLLPQWDDHRRVHAVLAWLQQD